MREDSEAILVSGSESEQSRYNRIGPASRPPLRASTFVYVPSRDPSSLRFERLQLSMRYQDQEQDVGNLPFK
jgi:hypothetical protein